MNAIYIGEPELHAFIFIEKEPGHHVASAMMVAQFLTIERACLPANCAEP